MGTYGPGEIAALCEWMTPDIAVITAIGPAHLERFKSLDRTLKAKAEITERAQVTVLNIDDERLTGLAKQLASAGKRVVTASGSDAEADVAVLPAPDGIELRPRCPMPPVPSAWPSSSASSRPRCCRAWPRCRFPPTGCSDTSRKGDMSCSTTHSTRTRLVPASR
jgi:hypothetical protein